MLYTFICFTTVKNFTTRCIYEFQQSLNVEMVDNFSLFCITSWALTIHGLGSLNHHFYKLLHLGFMNVNIIRCYASLA